LIALAGCTSALKEPPPVAEIGASTAVRSTGDPDSNDALIRADAKFDGLPDRAAVERAQQLYLDAAGAEDAPVDAFLGAAKATAWLIEHTDDGSRRAELATQGVQIGQWCRRLHPEEPECTYRLALAVGQQARERPSTATDGLDVMVELLHRVIAEAPELDHAGAERVLGLVLVRAPGWPTGPGDPESALEFAEAAAVAYPDYPPNQLVLGEVLLENGRRDEAKARIERGIEMARAGEVSGHPESADWISQAEELLAKIH
jgi:predicted RNA polymerase sigma factor